MAIAFRLIYMNTNLMTICNLLAQKSNGRASVPTHHNTQDAGPKSPAIIEEAEVSTGETDNNGNIIKNEKPNKNTPKFDDTLRKKINSDNSDNVNGDKKEKDSDNTKTEANLDAIFVPVNTTHVQPLRDADVIQPAISLNAESPEAASFNQSEKSDVAYSVEITSGTQEPETIIEGNKTTATIETTTIPPSAEITAHGNTNGETVITPDETTTPDMTIKSGEPDTFATENNYPGFDSIPKTNQSNNGTSVVTESSQTDVISNNKTSVNIEEYPANTNEPTTAGQPKETDKSVDFELKKSFNPLPDKDISDSTEKPSSQQNVPIAKENLSQKTAQSPTLNQDNNNQSVKHPELKQENYDPSAKRPELNQEYNNKNDIPLNQPVTQGMNISAEQINVFQSEKPHNLPEKRSVNVAFKVDEEFSVDTTKPSVFIEQPTVSPVSSKPVGNVNSGLGLGRQIQESVTSSYRPGTQQIIIRLDPPDLGRVTIKFIEQRDGITGILHVDRLDTKSDIQQALPGIIQNLQNSDIQIKKLEVVLNNQQQYNAPGENSTNQNGHFGQQNSSNQNSPTNPASYHDWLANSTNATNSADRHIELTDKTINMLI